MKKLDRNRLVQLSGERVFRRGEEYFNWQRVRSLVQANGSISAIVEGTKSYRVKLVSDDETAGFECNCPQGLAGRFCKHCVAAGLQAAHDGKFCQRLHLRNSRRRRTEADVSEQRRLLELATEKSITVEDAAALASVDLPPQKSWANECCAARNRTETVELAVTFFFGKRRTH